MDLWNSLSGMVSVELTGADIARSLDDLNQSGIEVYALEMVDLLCVRFCLSKSSVTTAQALLEKRGDKFVIRKRLGIYWTGRNLVSRPVLLVGLILLVASALYIPNHIYFIEIEGNQSVLTSEILSATEQCGISFGMPASVIRSERVKNELMDLIPQLQWVGVNTHGCVAVIQVREKESVPPAQQSAQYGSIVAARDGIVKSYTVERGNVLCRVGQAVQEGDVLISGYTDCGLVTKYTYPKGEILAETQRRITSVTPASYERVGNFVRQTKEYALRIGKNIINFSKDSGISYMSCGKMYEEKYIELPGGFRLPIAWICQTTYYYDESVQQFTEADVQLLADQTEKYLSSQMVGGTILTQETQCCNEDDILRFDAKYSCLEIIGRRSDKEILQEYEQTN